MKTPTTVAMETKVCHVIKLWTSFEKNLIQEEHGLQHVGLLWKKVTKSSVNRKSPGTNSFPMFCRLRNSPVTYMSIDGCGCSSDYRRRLTVRMCPAFSGRYVRSLLKNTCISSNGWHIFWSIWRFSWAANNASPQKRWSFDKDSLNFHTDMFVRTPHKEIRTNSEWIISWDANDRWGSEDLAAHSNKLWSRPFVDHTVFSIAGISIYKLLPG